MFKKILSKITAFRPSRRELVDEVLRLRSENFDLTNRVEELQMLEGVLAGKLKLWVDKHDQMLVKYKELLNKK